MTAPTFTRGTTPYWTYPCGCEASALALRHCATHAAAPALQALKDILGAADNNEGYSYEELTEIILPILNTAYDAGIRLAGEENTRTTDWTNQEDCPTCGSTLAEREDARLRAED